MYQLVSLCCMQGCGLHYTNCSVISILSVDGYNPEEPSLNAPSKILPPHLPPPPMHHSLMSVRPNFPSMPGTSNNHNYYYKPIIVINNYY